MGGCVRDLLLGRQPTDYDVSTDATPPEVMRIFPETFAVGAQFGVVLVPLKSLGMEPIAEPEGYGGVHPTAIEVATFRSDGAYTDGRHPDSVRFSRDAEHDVQRRDFTINGLMMDPLDGDRVIDHVGGRADLEAGVIRTIGEPARRFTEDKLRMLRAVRFAARFGYRIEAGTEAAIERMAHGVGQVSNERVRDELTKMLTEGHAREAFLRLDASGLLREVLPEVVKLKGVAQPPQYHPEGDVWVHTLLLLSMLGSGARRTLAWGALLHDVGKPATYRVAPDRIRFDGHVEVGTRMSEAVCRRLRFSNDDTEQISALVANHLRFADVRKMKQSTFKRFVRMPRFEEHLELHRIDCLGSHGHLDLYEFTREKMAAMPEEEVRPRPLLTGDDLIAAGYRPGPHFTQILLEVEDAQLEGQLRDRAAALEFVRRKHSPEDRSD